MPSFWFIAAIHAFLVHSLFGRIKQVLSGLILLESLLQLQVAHQDMLFFNKVLTIHQIFHILNKMMKKEFKRSFFERDEQL